MAIDIHTLGKSARMKITDRFDSSTYADFKRAYKPLITTPELQTIEIDVSALVYMDSAALGMLVELDGTAKIAKKSIVLVGVPGRVANILKTASADKLFTINLPSGVKMDLRS